MSTLHDILAAQAIRTLRALAKEHLVGTDQATAVLDDLEVTVRVTQLNPSATHLSPAQEAVLTVLEDGPCTMRQLANKSGYSYDHIRKNIVPELEQKGYLTRRKGVITRVPLPTG